VKSANRTLAPAAQAMEAFVLEQLRADAVWEQGTDLKSVPDLR